MLDSEGARGWGVLKSLHTVPSLFHQLRLLGPTATGKLGNVSQTLGLRED